MNKNIKITGLPENNSIFETSKDELKKELVFKINEADRLTNELNSVDSEIVELQYKILNLQYKINK